MEHGMESKEDTYLIIEEDTIYEIDLNCENCRGKEFGRTSSYAQKPPY